MQAACAAGVPVLVTVNPWTRGDDFIGSLAVLSDLGEPHRPSTAMVGTACAGKSVVDPEMLRRWHAVRSAIAT